jgi:RecA-family ATPase
VPLHILPADGSLDQSLRLDDDGTGLERLAATICAREVGMMILDPLRELHAGKENDADHMAVILRPLRQLAHAMGVTVVLMHHKNKYGTDAATAVRGSTAITASADQIITLTVSGDDDELTPAQVVTLRAEGRYGPRQKIVAHLGTGLRWEVTEAAPLDRSLPGRISDLLRVEDTQMDADTITARLEAKKGSVQNALREMVKSGTVRRLGKGSKASPFGYALHANGWGDER